MKKRRRNQDLTKEIIHEIAVLIKCENTNRVIRLHEVYESVTDMVLVLELAAGGELQQILDSGQCLGEVISIIFFVLLFSNSIIIVIKLPFPEHNFTGGVFKFRCINIANVGRLHSAC